MDWKRLWLITYDGKVRHRRRMTLEQKQKFVGGYIELVTIPGFNHPFLVNEDGLLKNLPRNIIFPQFVGNIILLEAQ